MAKVLVTAPQDIQRTYSKEINVSITDVKRWMRDEYGTPSEHGMEWEDVLMEYVEENLEIDWMDADVDEVAEEPDIENVEEI